MRRSVIAVAVLVVLAGCGGDPKVSPSPTPSSPVTSPVSTTPTPPALPDAAKANTKAGAIAFVRHYIDLINYAQATGDVDALEAVEDAGCNSCSQGREAIRKIYEAGGRIEGGALHFEIDSGSRSGRYQGWLVTGALKFDPSVLEKSDNTQQELKGGSTPANAFVSSKNESGEWRVMNWTRGS